MLQLSLQPLDGDAEFGDHKHDAGLACGHSPLPRIKVMRKPTARGQALSSARVYDVVHDG